MTFTQHHALVFIGIHVVYKDRWDPSMLSKLFLRLELWMG